MIPRDVKAPTIPIPFHKLLKVVAIVDDKDPQTKELIDQLTAENFEVEVSGFDRDVSEDASVGAYILRSPRVTDWKRGDASWRK